MIQKNKRNSLDDLFNLEGEVALVTGGASGLGHAMAHALAHYGAKVAIADIDADRLSQTQARLAEIGFVVDTYCLDVRNAAALQDAVTDIVRTHGQLDVAMVNAGVSTGRSPATKDGAIENVPLDVWQGTMDVNLTGAFYTLQAVATVMKRQCSGRIVVTASAAGLAPMALVGYPYAASKAALAHLVRHAAAEFAAYGIRINALAPGPFVTAIAGGALNRPGAQEAYESVTLMQRVAQPEEIWGPALLLASHASSFMTGCILQVDGGLAICGVTPKAIEVVSPSSNKRR